MLPKNFPRINYGAPFYGFYPHQTVKFPWLNRVSRGKMVPKLFFFIQATILSTASSNCLNEPFSLCGIRYLKYPFWGGTHGLECGLRGFQIICNAAAGEPLLNISSLLYKVQSQLDFSTNTLKLSRQDLIQSKACPKHLLRNTTLDPLLFRFPPNSTDRNLTLYLDCRGDGLQNLPNHYKCDKKIHLFTTADNSSGPGPGVKCKNTIVVPVNQKNAESLEDPTASSVNILRSALASGFSIQWLSQSDCGADVCVHPQPNASVPERRRGNLVLIWGFKIILCLYLQKKKKTFSSTYNSVY